MIIEAYLRAGLNLLDSVLIKLSSIGVPVLDVELVFDTSSLTLGEAAAMNVANPLKVRLDLSNRSSGLEGDDVFAGDLVRTLAWCGGSTKSGGQESSQVESETKKASHD